MSPLRVATYNVRRCVGADGRQDVGRVAAALGELDADVVALQEAEARPSRSRPSSRRPPARPWPRAT